MSAQRYERVRPFCVMPLLKYVSTTGSDGALLTDVWLQVSDRDDDGAPRISDDHDHQPMTPASPPPSFHSRASSPTAHHLLSAHDPLISDAERALADSFDSPSDDEDIHGVDDRRIHRGAEPSETTAQGGGSPPASEAGRRGVERRVTQLPIFPSSTSTASTPTASAAPGRGLSRPTNDGVFANLSAKPERGEKSEDQPPVCDSYLTSVFRIGPTKTTTRPTNKPRQMPPLRIGRRRSWHRAWAAMKSSSMVFPLAPSSPLPGMA